MVWVSNRRKLTLEISLLLRGMNLTPHSILQALSQTKLSLLNDNLLAIKMRSFTKQSFLNTSNGVMVNKLVKQTLTHNFHPY